MIRRALQPNLLRRSLAVSVGGGKVAVTGHSMRGGAAAFSPMDLFAAGEPGAWYDPSDLSTLFQDSDGIIPVTADGQPVGRLLDKSGNNNHLIQVDAARRPLYKTDGVLWWLQFDGVDDKLTTISVDKTAWAGGLCVTGSKWFGASPGPVIDGADSAPTANHEPNGPSGSWYVAFGGDERINPPELIPALTPHILTRVRNETATVVSMNSGDKTTVACATGFGGVSVILLAMNDLGGVYEGCIYSVVLLARTPTTQEITDTELWVAKKTGVTLP